MEDSIIIIAIIGIGIISLLALALSITDGEVLSSVSWSSILNKPSGLDLDASDDITEIFGDSPIVVVGSGNNRTISLNTNNTNITVVNQSSFWNKTLSKIWAFANIGINENNPQQELVVKGTINTTDLVLNDNCADGEVLKWSSGVATCGTDNTGGGNGGDTINNYYNTSRQDLYFVLSNPNTDYYIDITQWGKDAKIKIG